MSINTPNRVAIAAGLFLAISTQSQAQQAAAQADTVAQPSADIVLTPGRGPQSIARSGSAVTVVTAEEIEKIGAKSTADIFRDLPGVSVTENGGPGQASTIRIRGAESRHTLVLVDGIAVNDPSTGSNEFDLNSLVAADIQRIEVLRGPQSALYGSDAIGGVVNILTRKGRGGHHGFASIEGGSYGNIAGRAGISGGTQDFDYAIAISGVRADGFSTYGYRIPRITRLLNQKLENDPFARLGGSAKFAWRPFEGVEIETGLTSNYIKADYDAAYGARPDTLSQARGRLTTAYVKATADAFEGRLRNSVTLFGNYSSRNYNDISFYDFGTGLTREWDKYDYTGKRFGAEYQGDAKLDQFGKLIFGARIEEERLESRTRPIESAFNVAEALNARRTTRSIFALHQLPIGERFDFSLGGRVDDIVGGDRFATWRATGAYRITEWGTKLRASVGTGGKAPSLFQTYSPQYGTRSLSSERSVGGDVGIDQRLFDGRLNLSLTGFYNKLTNLIDFSPFDPNTFTYPTCPITQAYTGCYINVGRARTQGVEVAGSATLIEGVLAAKASYTYLDARDLTTHLRLARRPTNQGRLSLSWTPIEKLTIEPIVSFVGERFSSANEKLRLKSYARFDLRADYQVHKNLNLYLRAENLTNVRYEEVYNYGTTGRAIYVGARASW